MKTMESPATSFLESLVGGAKKSSSMAGSAVNSVAKKTASSMASVQRVNCPTCGSSAERHRSLDNSLVRTQCSRCDYLMVLCSETGRVVEAYAPSFSPAAFAS